jgi:vacuolar-type H+-ATPase catalytic subunit A/Vma1
MIAPKLSGRVVEIMPQGNYNCSQTVAVIEDNNGKQREIRMSHMWPVRNPRPVAEKLPGKTPLLTG